MEAKKLVTAGRVGANGDDVTTWALPEGAIARLGRGSVRDMAFSPDGQYFAVGTAIGLWLYELPTLSPIALWDTERGMIDTAIFSSDSRRIVTYTFCEELKIWDVQSGTCVTRIAIPNKRHTSRPVFSQDGQRIAVVSYEKNGKIYIWCAHTGTQLSESEIGETYGIYPFQFSPDTRLLAGRKRATDSDPESILVWHVETEEQIGCFTGYPEKMEKLCFSLDGRYLAAGSSDGTIHVWDVESEQLATTYTDYGDAQIFPYYEPEDGLIAAAVSDRKVEVWHIEQNEKLDEFEHRGNSRYACFSENGKQLAVASPSEIKVWAKGDTTSHTLSTLDGHSPTVDTIVFSSDEETLAAGLWSDNVLLWDVASKRSYRPHSENLPGNSQNVYRSPDGKLISTRVDGGALTVWEVGNREPIAQLTPPEAGLLRTEAFASIGYRLARADRDSNIRVWECTSASDDRHKSESWKKHTTLVGHTGPVDTKRFSMLYIVALTFSPDGKRLASISRDCTVYLWDVDAGQRMAELPLTPPRRGTYGEYKKGIAFLTAWRHNCWWAVG